MTGSTVRTIDVRINLAADTVRSCGSCTACCDGWVTGVIRGHEMKPGTPCHFRGDRCCSIYGERPANPCRNFFCEWRLRGNPFPESFRPDRIGVMILGKRWRNRVAYELISAGRDPDEALVAWFRDHCVATGVPFIYSVAGEGTAFGPPEFQRDMLDRSNRGESLL